MLVFRTKQEALAWIKKETGYTPVSVETYSLSEYYRSNARFFSIRYNRKKHNFSCRDKIMDVKVKFMHKRIWTRARA